MTGPTCPSFGDSDSDMLRSLHDDIIARSKVNGGVLMQTEVPAYISQLRDLAEDGICQADQRLEQCLSRGANAVLRDMLRKAGNSEAADETGDFDIRTTYSVPIRRKDGGIDWQMKALVAMTVGDVRAVDQANRELQGRVNAATRKWTRLANKLANYEDAENVGDVFRARGWSLEKIDLAI